MNLVENIKIAFEGLRLNKMRSFLTMLGIIIGISSVIGIWTIGEAMSKSVSKGFDQIGNTIISISTAPKPDYDWNDVSQKDGITRDSIDVMTSRFSEKIKAIALSGEEMNGQVKANRKNIPVKITSTTPGQKDVGNIKMISGRFLEDLDILKNREIAVVSDKVVESVFKGKNDKALGAELEVSTTNGIKVYTIVGIYKYKQISFGVLGGERGAPTTPVYIPLPVGARQFGSKDSDPNKFFSFSIAAVSREGLQETATSIESFFNDNYFKNNQKVKISANTIQAEAESVTKVMGTVKMSIGAIAAISLIVGGIGVMNILLVSVTERTREIGIRKALGATSKDIRGQFIIESIIICIIGGAIGVLLGGGLGYGGSILLKTPTLPTPLSIIVAVGFSMFIGIFFGYYPSNKAAQLNPIDALRYE